MIYNGHPAKASSQSRFIYAITQNSFHALIFVAGFVLAGFPAHASADAVVPTTHSAQDDHTKTMVRSSAIIYYVSPSGNDANSGTSASSPLRTINKALAAASSGSTVKLAAVSTARTW